MILFASPSLGIAISLWLGQLIYLFYGERHLLAFNDCLQSVKRVLCHVERIYYIQPNFRISRENFLLFQHFDGAIEIKVR